MEYLTKKMVIWSGGRWRRVSADGRVEGWRRRAQIVLAVNGALIPVSAAQLPNIICKGPRLPLRPAKYRHHSKTKRSLRKSTPLKEVPTNKNISASEPKETQERVVAKENNLKQKKIVLQQKPRGIRSDSTETLKLTVRDAKANSSQEKVTKSSQKTDVGKREDIIQKVLETQDTETEDTGKSREENFKELVIDEEDVILLRNFIRKNAENISIDLHRFDSDEGYRTLVFYRINPLVAVERCPHIARLLRERFARSLGLKVNSAINDGSSSDDEAFQVPSKRLRENRSPRPLASQGSKDRATDWSRDRARGRAKDTSKERSKHRTSRAKARSKDRAKDRSKDSSEERSKDRTNRTKDRSKDRARNRVKDRSKDSSEERSKDRTNRTKDRSNDSSDEPFKDRAKNQSKDKLKERTKEKSIKKLSQRSKEYLNKGPPMIMPRKSCVANGREYSSLEDHAIISWLNTSELRQRAVNGNRIWRELQSSYNSLTGIKRSWHSLRNRYLRYILPALGSLAIPERDAARLRSNAATGELKSQLKNRKRRNSALFIPRVPRAHRRERLLTSDSDSEPIIPCRRSNRQRSEDRPYDPTKSQSKSRLSQLFKPKAKVKPLLTSSSPSSVKTSSDVKENAGVKTSSDVQQNADVKTSSDVKTRSDKTSADVRSRDVDSPVKKKGYNSKIKSSKRIRSSSSDSEENIRLKLRSHSQSPVKSLRSQGRSGVGSGSGSGSPRYSDVTRCFALRNRSTPVQTTPPPAPPSKKRRLYNPAV